MTPEQKYKIDTFLGEKSELPKLVVIYGPTASGKTGLSIEVAKYLNSEVISIDARQVYRHMNIGTGKVTEDEMGGIPHHMLDIIEPSEAFSVVDFRERVEKLEIWRRFLETDENSKMGVRENSPAGKGDVTEGQGDLVSNKIPPTLLRHNSSPKSGELETFIKGEQKHIPVLCGGTGLYIDSLIFERSYPSIEADWERREELEQFRVEHGNQALWDKLNTLDPTYAQTLHPNDRHYIIRGIEVFEKTGKSKAENIDIPKLKYDTLFLTPYDGNREVLYSRINERVYQMFNSGLVDEVQYIMNTFGSDCPGLATIGYKEVVQYLKGEITLEECIAEVQQHNRNYAKRQITWNKKYGKYLNYAN